MSDLLMLPSEVARLVRRRLRNPTDETVKTVLAAQREHTIKSVGYTDTSGTTTTNGVIWTGWKCLGCTVPIDSQREADEHPIRMGLAALAGGDA